MGRPRGKSYPVNPSRLLPSTNAPNVSVVNLRIQSLNDSSIPEDIQEDLEHEARASLSLFGFGNSNGVNWRRIRTTGSEGNSVRLKDRVCPIGYNPFLTSKINAEYMSSSSNNLTNDVTWNQEGKSDVDIIGQVDEYSSQLLQQYFVKATTMISARKEEIINNIVRSDKNNMDTVMQHMTGVKNIGSGTIFSRNKARLRRDDAELNEFQDDEDVSYDYESGSEVDPNQENNNISNYTNGGYKRTDPSLSILAQELNEALSNANKGNLSIKWAVGEKVGRVFTSHENYCLLDYECVLINDWESDHPVPMYVRSLQSCYLSHCQPWIDEMGSSTSHLEPVGIMVRDVKKGGYCEIQFVASILENASMPISSRRAKLRALCSRINKLEDLVVSQRLSKSLLSKQPLWVRNGARAFCHGCTTKFTFSRRKHHCRICGEVYCGDCSPKMDLNLPDVGTISVRVCILCLKNRRKSSITQSTSGYSSECSLVKDGSLDFLPLQQPTSDLLRTRSASSTFYQFRGNEIA